MTSNNPPIKVVFFDIGGVCVLSPMIAIIEYETNHAIPSGYINFAISASGPNGAWQKLERNEIPLDASFYVEFSRDLGSAVHWREFHAARQIPLSSAVPPTVDGETLFWEMMAKGREQDKVVIAAVRRLRATGKFRIGALTNDYRYPDGHPYSVGKKDLVALFDVWVASSEVGMRKPEEAVYRLAMERAGVTDGREVAFCDDIGTNLKAAGRLGWRTIKVEIGRSREAVRKLEEITGVKLLDEAASKL